MSSKRHHNNKLFKRERLTATPFLIVALRITFSTFMNDVVEKQLKSKNNCFFFLFCLQLYTRGEYKNEI